MLKMVITFTKQWTFLLPKTENYVNKFQMSFNATNLKLSSEAAKNNKNLKMSLSEPKNSERNLLLKYLQLLYLVKKHRVNLGYKMVNKLYKLPKTNTNLKNTIKTYSFDLEMFST